MPLQVLVRSVYAPSQSTSFTVDPESTIQDLKSSIQQEFPGNPASKDQKLIFGGRVLPETDKLGDVLKLHHPNGETEAKSEDSDVPSVVLHLLIPSTLRSVTNETPEPSLADPEPPSSTPEPPAPAPEPTNPTPVQPPAPETSAAAPSPAFQPQMMPMSMPGMVAASGMPDWMQYQMLLQQQMMLLTQLQYLQQLQAHLEQNGQTRVPPIPANVAPPPHPAANTPNNNNTPPPPGQQTLMGELQQHVVPLFDLRLLVKMGFMLFLIGQDTPWDGLLVLITISFISYLHITGILAKLYEIFMRRHGRQVEPQQEAAPNVVPNAISNGLNVSAILEVNNERTGFVQDVKYFFGSFVMSLVPAWQPGGNDGHRDNGMPVDDMPLQGL